MGKFFFGCGSFLVICVIVFGVFIVKVLLSIFSKNVIFFC